MNIKPWRVLYLYLLTGAIFLLLTLTIPKDGLKVFENKTIRWISRQTLLLKEPSIKKIETANQIKLDSIIEPEITGLKFADSIITIDTLIARNNLIFKSRDINSLSNFFKSLKEISLKDKPIHILHYGDSQLDGDRITRYLRDNYQQKYGGVGCGFISGIDPVKQLSSVYIESKGEWEINWVYDEKRSKSNTPYGLIGSSVENIEGENPSIIFRHWETKLSKTESYTTAKVFASSNKPNQVIRCFADKALYQTDTLNASQEINILKYQFPYPLHHLEFQFNRNETPTIHGILLDGEKGVQVDNLALRGQLFTRFLVRDSTLVTTMAKEIDIQLIILQFGDNLLPTPASEDFSFYTQLIKDQINHIRNFIPNVPIIVVGVGDSAERIDGVLRTRASVAPIMKAQKLAALESNALYFDLFAAMGGAGSIIKWADEEPKRAVSDYTHFNQKGGKEVANLIFTAIENEYQFWLSQQN